MRDQETVNDNNTTNRPATVLFYDVMSFEWRFVASKVDLASYISSDVLETLKGKIKELSVDLQHLLIIMAYVPNTLDDQLLVFAQEVRNVLDERDTDLDHLGLKKLIPLRIFR